MNYSRQSFSSHSFAAACRRSRPAPAFLHACTICRMACGDSCSDGNCGLVSDENLVAAESSAVACWVEGTPSCYQTLKCFSLATIKLELIVTKPRFKEISFPNIFISISTRLSNFPRNSLRLRWLLTSNVQYWDISALVFHWITVQNQREDWENAFFYGWSENYDNWSEERCEKRFRDAEKLKGPFSCDSSVNVQKWVFLMEIIE